MATEVEKMELSKPEKREKPVNQEVSEKLYNDSLKKKVQLREWIESVKQEIRVIHWTSREELKVYTQIVVGGTFFFGMGVYFTDLGIHGTLNLLNYLSRIIFG